MREIKNKILIVLVISVFSIGLFNHCDSYFDQNNANSKKGPQNNMHSYQSQTFRVNPLSVLISNGDSSDSSSSNESIEFDSFLLFMFGLGITLFIIIIGSVYFLFKKGLKNRELKKWRIYNNVMDVFNLNYILITQKNTGLQVYEQSFILKKANPTLISGYLEAINAFGIELTGSYKTSQTIRLEYHHLQILMSEFKNFRIILILNKSPSKDFLKTISALSYEIENKYGKLIVDFKGDLSLFNGIPLLIEKYLYTPLISPLKIGKMEMIKLNAAEKLLVNKARDIMKNNNFSHFYSTFLLPNQRFNFKDAELILKLIDKNVFQPIKTNLTIKKK